MSIPQMRSEVQPVGPGAQEDSVQDRGGVLGWPEFTQNVPTVGRRPSTCPPPRPISTQLTQAPH